MILGIIQSILLLFFTIIYTLVLVDEIKNKDKTDIIITSLITLSLIYCLVVSIIKLF